ncbi:branched-chain amino acid ABC transporter permease, partial [Mesorhizobium sp. M8A.F.Ca.ET.023.02.2.1]
LLGGIGSMVGPIIGASLVVGLENTVTITTGLIFMVCVLIFRRDIVGELYARLLKRPGRG